MFLRLTLISREFYFFATGAKEQKYKQDDIIIVWDLEAMYNDYIKNGAKQRTAKERATFIQLTVNRLTELDRQLSMIQKRR